MALPESVEPLQHPFADAPILAADDLEQARREAAEREDLKRQIDFAIDEINTNPNIPSELKTELVNNLRSLKTGLGVNPNLAQVQKEINDARALAHQASSTSAIYNSLSAAGQMAVDARVNALNEGRFADYYFNSFDPEQKLSEQTRDFLKKEINADPEIAKNAKTAQAIDNTIKKTIESRYAHYSELIKAKLEDPSISESMRQDYETIKRYHLERIPGVGEKLSSATPEDLHKIVEEGMKQRMELAQPMIDRMGRNTIEGKLMLQQFSSDGHTVDIEKLMEAGSSKEGQAALNALGKVGWDLSKLPESQRALAVAAKTFNLASANYGMQSQILCALREMDLQSKAGEKGHDNHFSAILNNGLPDDQRVSFLMEELREHNLNMSKDKISDSELQDHARQFIQTLKTLKDPEKAVRGDFERAVKFEEVHSALDAEYGSHQVEKLLSVANADPSSMMMLKGALRVLDPTSAYSPETKSHTRQALGTAISAANNPELSDSFSRIRYYNLADTAQGQQVLNQILRGQIDAGQALNAVVALQNESLSHMQPVAPYIPKLLTQEYQDRLAKLGMFQANGSLDVEKLIETARINRDALGDDDTAIKAAASKPWEQLSEFEKDRRVVARAAIRFKAIEAIKTFGHEIDVAYARENYDATKDSAQLQENAKLYNQMLDGSKPDVQRQAFDTLLKQQQYLRVNDDLRAEVIENIIILNEQNPRLLRSSELLGDREQSVVEAPDAAPLPTPTQTQFTREEIATLNHEGSRNAGDDIFENRMENRIKKALKNVDMSEIVATFGQLIAQPDDPKSPGTKNNKNYISTNELENALMAVQILDPQTGKKLTDDQVFKLVDKNNDGQLTAVEMVDYLKQNGELATGMDSTAASVAEATRAAPSTVPQAPPATPTPTPGR